MFSKQNLKKIFGYVIIFIFSITPVIFWMTMDNLSARFFSLGSTFTSLGQLTALVGMALFSITLILSARFKFLEEYFGGQNRAYINHHYLGALAFILLLFHPLFLASKFLMISVSATVSFLTPWMQDKELFLGSMGLFAMIASLFFTFYKKLPYQIWKQTHRFLGLAFFLGGLHMFLIESDVSRNMSLRVFMLFLAGLGVVSLFYRVILKKILVKTYRYEVDHIFNPNKNIFEVILIPKGENLIYKAGQFAFVGFTSSLLPREVHPYSFASREQNNKISFVIKVLGDYTAKIDNLRKGDIALIEGPFGLFNISSSKTEKQIWIAGGIGVTPFLSMARSLDLENYKKYSVDLFYSVKTREELVYVDELREIAKNTGRLRLFEIVTETDGFLTAEKVYVKSGLDKDIFICGPLPMMAMLREQFEKRGVLRSSIHTEEFALQ